MSVRWRVLLVEDDPRLQRALPRLLGPERQLSIVATAQEAEKHVATHETDLVLVDLGLPDRDGVLLIESLTRSHPGMPLLVLTAATERSRVLAAMHAGACGYLLKEDLPTRLKPAVEEAIQGGMPMSPAIAHFVLEQLRSQPASEPDLGPPVHLTERERDVLKLLSQGLTYAEIGHTLGISINTVRAHVRASYEKLHASSKAEAVTLALKGGLLRD